ncbi:MAG: HAMP domain-containing histidine kinase [Flavobacterium sp.]|nr:HAMP domain-containing histidine kinase [Flavobacterium sp.]
MKREKNFYLVLFISITIVATIGLQVFWNIKNYNQNKTRLIAEVQTALDKSIEYYYVDYLKDNFVAFVKNDKKVNSEQFFESVDLKSALKNIPQQKKKNKKKIIDSKVDTTSTFVSVEIKSDSKTIKKSSDSIKMQIENEIISSETSLRSPKVSFKEIEPTSIKAISVFKGKKDTDSIMAIKNLANKIVISMFQDTIEFKALSNALEKELNRKNILIDYQLQHYKGDTLYNTFQTNKNGSLSLKSISKSAYLPKKEEIAILFSNPITLVLKRSLSEILLSLVLSLSIITCLLYLLKTINKQKKIDEIKNDLISNITHEFKTPITTIGTAIEGIKSFNTEKDIEKTNRYLEISGNQLKKLEEMVERLLETATLETNQLSIKKEKANLLLLLQNCIEKHQLNFQEKNIVLETKTTDFFANVDSFHLENAFSNIIDNAVKYGGNEIKITLNCDKFQNTVLIEDNGFGIDKIHEEKIFDKFYRIPKGNIHNVKGFGIGLYYSKKIIEKHGGSLELLSNSNPTLFKITLPNEY